MRDLFGELGSFSRFVCSSQLVWILGICFFAICLGFGDLGICFFFPRFVWDLLRDLFGDLGICVFRDLFGDLGIRALFFAICLGI